MNYLTQIIFTYLLIAIAWILTEMEVKAERRTFDFFKKHHHKHRKEDHHHNEHYLEDTEFDNYHDLGLYNGRHYPSVHIHHTYGINGYGIGELGFHGGAIHSSGIYGNNLYGGNFHGGYIGGNHFGSGIFVNEELEHNNLLGIQDGGVVHGEFGEVHEYGGNHGAVAI